MTMGAWGTHYERTQTWWELTGPWHLYLARCQHMLRQGLPVADLLYLTPEGAPMRFVAPEVNIRDAVPPDTPGYNLDGCPPDALFTRVRSAMARSRCLTVSATVPWYCPIRPARCRVRAR
jgi:hypothetical protein